MRTSYKSKYGTVVIGDAEPTDLGGYRRRDEYRPHEPIDGRVMFIEISTAAALDDDSPPVFRASCVPAQLRAEFPGARDYSALCACCFLGTRHTTRYHDESIERGKRTYIARMPAVAP